MNLQKYKYKGIFILPAWSVGPSQHKTAEAVFEFIKLIDIFKISLLFRIIENLPDFTFL